MLKCDQLVIKNQKHMNDEPKYTQIQEQYKKKHEQPTVLIERTDHSIQTARLTEIQDEYGRRYAEFTDADGEVKVKPMSNLSLEDANQLALAEELAASMPVNEATIETAKRSDLLRSIHEVETNVSKEVREDLGEAALEALGVDEPMNMFQSRLGETPKIPDTQSKNVSDVDRAREAKTQLEGLRGRLGATPEATAEKKPDVTAAETQISAILGENMKGGGALGDALRMLGESNESIRTALSRETADDTARKNILQYIKARMTMIEDSLPERVKKNRNKAVSKDRYGVDSMLSMDYAAELALAKLDGSFEYDQEVKLDDGSLKVDQHRGAADLVLADFAKDQVVDRPGVIPQDEVLQSFRNRLKQRIDSSEGTFQYIANMQDNLEYILQQHMVDTDEVAQLTHGYFAQIENISQSILDLEKDLAQVEVAQTEDAAPARAAVDHLSDTFSLVKSKLQSLQGYESYSFSGMLRQTIYQNDQMSILAVKNAMNRGQLQEERDILSSVRRQLADLV